MCSLLASGSASIPTMVSNPDTYPSTSSATGSASAASAGASSPPTTSSGTPELDPGV